MECMFSGEEPDSNEHVIPRWLQKRFNLREQIIMIPGGTGLKYKHLRVPVSTGHNIRFGSIEKSISQGNYELHELYLWALKIHIGLIFRDSTLRLRLDDQNSPRIVDIGKFESELALFRMLYRVWDDGGITDPSPIGSVFVLDSLLPQHDFDFFHCPTTGTIGINLGEKFIIVFLWDQGDGMRANLVDQWERYHLPQVESRRGCPDYDAYCYFSHHVWACESAYWLYRNRRSFNFLYSRGILALASSLVRKSGRSPDETEYRLICRSFGLELQQFGGESHNVYAQHTVSHT